MNTFAMGLGSDKLKPMNIKAKQVYIDDKSGFSEYNGNVILVQGTMKITADKLTIIYDAKQNLNKIIAIGNPSTYRQRPDNKKEDIQAKAQKMVYFAKKDLMVLTGKALMQQGSDKFTSNKIRYFLNKDRVETFDPSKDNSKNKDTGRVNIILDPNKK